MKCPKCQTENPEGMKFCGECGARLEKVCPNCNFSNPPQFRFCGECGHDLTLPSKPIPKELSFDEKLAKIQRYLPKDLTQKILAQRDRIEGERKLVTVMFCDMEGYTSLTEKLGSEQMYSIMDEVYEILIHRVHDYEGTVNELTGDGIMALFGAPIALEDAPQRAIRSALAIHREINKFSEQLKSEKRIPSIKMRIGIHTGPVIVGTLGNDLRVEFKAVGDTVNLASRMEGLADPGTTFVTGETFKLAEGLFRFESLGERKVKGREEPVWVYKVIAPSSSRTRFDVSAERGLTPFVGRSREMELLLDGLGRAREGRGQAFSIIGEAGVGKSRLLYEFRKAISNENVTFLEGKCLSYGRGAAYHPITDILRGAFDIHEGDKDSQIRERVENGLKILRIEPPSALPYMLELLGVRDREIEKISMSPEGKKDRIIETLKQFLLKSSGVRPLVIATEDLHWVDQSTEEVLKYLLEGIPAARVLLVFTYRPEFVHAWGGKSYHNQITVNRLSNRESLIMAASLLGTDRAEKGIEELILARTEGIPFFIEELIKSLKDLNIIRKEENKYRLVKAIQEVKIPSTIQDMIMARVDALPPNAKDLLQAGSVIEREFSYALIKQVTGLDDKELLGGFSLLKEAELVYERGIFPQLTFIFKHALTHQVVYDSLLTMRKKALHQKVGKAIETIYAENLELHFGLMGTHFMEGEDFEKGAEYSKRAMQRAAELFWFYDAIEYARKRVNCIEKLPQTDQNQLLRIRTRADLAVYLSAMNLLYDAKEVIEPIIDLARSHNDKKSLSRILFLLGTCSYWVEEDYPKAFEILEEAIKMGEEVKDWIPIAGGSFFYGVGLAHDCQFEKGAHYIQKSVDINKGMNRLSMVAVQMGSLSVMCHFFSGNMRACFRTASEAVEVAEISGDTTFSQGPAYASYGYAHLGEGCLIEAEENFLKSIEHCERSNWAQWLQLAGMGLGETYYRLGQFSKSKEHFVQSAEIHDRTQVFPSLAAYSQLGALRAEIRGDRKVDGLDVKIREGMEWFKKTSLKSLQGAMARYIAETFMYSENQHVCDAEHWIQVAIGIDQSYGLALERGHAYALYADLFKRKGDRLKAQENLGKAIEILKECGADGWVEKYEKELVTLL